MVTECNFLLGRMFGNMELFKENTRNNNTFTFSHLSKALQPSLLCHATRKINELAKKVSSENFITPQ